MNITELQTETQQETIEKQRLKNNLDLKSIKELEEECRSHMLERNYTYRENFDTSGELIKFNGRNKSKNKTEWYKATQQIDQDGRLCLTVTYNSHHSDLKSDNHHVFFSKNSKPLNDKEKEEQKKRVTQLQQERKKREELEKFHSKEQIIKDQNRFEKASIIGESAYLIRKQVEPHDIRFEDNIILIPMKNEQGEIQALQEIHPIKKVFQENEKPRDKNFTNSTKGLYHTIGKINDGQLIRVSEGYATAASVYESTDCQIPHVVAFSASGYKNVIPTLKKLYPNSPILICADNNIQDDIKKRI